MPFLRIARPGIVDYVRMIMVPRQMNEEMKSLIPGVAECSCQDRGRLTKGLSRDDLFTVLRIYRYEPGKTVGSLCGAFQPIRTQLMCRCSTPTYYVDG